MTENDIGAEGAKHIGDALKTNTTLTTLYLQCEYGFALRVSKIDRTST